MYEIRNQSAIINFLLSNRVLRTHINKNEIYVEREKELAAILLTASTSFRQNIDEHLAETGFRIITCESSRTIGLPIGATHFLLIRDVEENVPSWLHAKNIYIQLSLNDNESKTTTRIWFFFIWSNMLSLLYSQKTRPLSNISAYLKSNFTKKILITQVRSAIEEARQKTPESMLEVIASEKGREVDRRVSRFIEFMIAINYLSKEKEGDETYFIQTLLMAIELKENFSAGLGYRFKENLSPMDNVKEEMYERTDLVEEEYVVTD